MKIAFLTIALAAAIFSWSNPIVNLTDNSDVILTNGSGANLIE